MVTPDELLTLAWAVAIGAVVGLLVLVGLHPSPDALQGLGIR
jgi:hypothetical protein